MQILRRSERKRQPSILDVFTDRVELIAAFERNLEHKKPGEHRVLVFYGDGGIGKTTLLQKLEQLHRQRFPQARMGRLDLVGSDTTPPDLLLYGLRRQFPTIPFPSFSLALAEYGRRFHPERVYGNDRKELLQGAGPYADVLDIGLEALADCSGVTQLLKIMKAASAANRHLSDWVLGRAEPWLKPSQSLSEEQFLAQLPLQWARDFRQALSSDLEQEDWDDPITYSGPPPLIALDTYETLWHPGMRKFGRLQEPREQWLVDLVSELPEVLWVISGRDRLTWGERYDRDWSEACEQHLVGQLSEEDARSFLTKRGIKEPAIVKKILREAAGVPFYLELEAQLYHNTPANERTPEVFGGSHQQLIDRLLTHLDDSMQATLRLLATFGIWDQDLFRQAVTHFATGYPATGAAELGRFWSIEAIGEGRWQLHNEMAHHLQSNERHHNPANFNAMHRWGFAYFDGPLQGLEAKAIQAEDAERLQRALSHARNIHPAAEWAAWLVKRLVQLEKGTIWQPLLAVTERAVQQAEQELGGSDPAVAGLLNRQATLLQQIARYEEAEPLFRRALAIEEASYGPDHPEVAMPLSNLATLQQATNRLREAEPLMRRALAIVEASDGPGHPNVATALSNLATLLKATDRLAEAEPLMRRALAIDEASSGPDHPNVATALSNLASLLEVTNRLPEAEKLMRRALAIDEGSYGPDHPDVASDLNNLAILLLNTNRLAEAEPLMRQAWAIEEASFGPNHPNVARYLSNLAMLLLDTNRLAEAEPLMRRALAIEEVSYGPDHPNVAIRLNNLARLLGNTNRLAEAEALMRRALAIDEASYGLGHPNVAIRLDILSRILHDIGLYEEAESHARRALSIDEVCYGPEHPNVAFDLNSLAMILKATDRLPESDELMRRSLDILQGINKQGHEHPKWQTYLKNYMTILVAQGFSSAEAEARLHALYQYGNGCFPA